MIAPVLSDKCELVSIFAAGLISAGAELAPLGESGGAVILEVLSAGEGPVLVEVIADGSVDGDELLQSPPWSGLGRRPSWVRAAVDAGPPLDDLAV